MQDTPRQDTPRQDTPSDGHDPIGEIERAIDLDTDVTETWRLAGTAEGWAEWLVDVADITIAEGATGTVVDDDITFGVEIERVDHGRALMYRWFDADEPDIVTTVRFTIDATPDGGSRLVINERGPLAASASAWDVRTGIARMVVCLASAPRLASV